MPDKLADQLERLNDLIEYYLRKQRGYGEAETEIVDPEKQQRDAEQVGEFAEMARGFFGKPAAAGSHTDDKDGAV